MNQGQFDLLEEPSSLPGGFRYRPDFLSKDEERDLVERFADLPFKEFEFQGYRGNRRVLSFGWQYDFNRMELQRTEDMPEFLLPLRERAVRFADLEASDLQHVLLTEYAPGAGIGWHRDKPMFAEVVGISLGSPCVFRFRRKAGSKWERASVVADPRSMYLLQGPSRTEWEHSIPAVDHLRYSITSGALGPHAILIGNHSLSCKYRLHGSPRIYYSAYNPEYLAAITEVLARDSAAGVETWCIFTTRRLLPRPVTHSRPEALCWPVPKDSALPRAKGLALLADVN